MEKIDLWKACVQVRKVLGENETSPIDIFALAYQIPSLTIVNYPMGKNLSGMCIPNVDSNVIAINSEMSLGRQRFSLAHELYHLIIKPEQVVTVCKTSIGDGNEIENEADCFASYFLMPPSGLAEFIDKIKSKAKIERLTLKEVLKIEQQFQVSHQAVLHRLVDDGELSKRDADAMRFGVVNAARNEGYAVDLYRPTPPDKQYGAYGHYIKQAEKALAQNLISDGKYEELLLNAYRADLVYGDETEGGEVDD